MCSDHELQLCVGRWMKAGGYERESSQVCGREGGGADGKNKNVKQQRRLGRKADGPLTHFCLKCE